MTNNFNFRAFVLSPAAFIRKQKKMSFNEQKNRHHKSDIDSQNQQKQNKYNAVQSFFNVLEFGDEEQAV